MDTSFIRSNALWRLFISAIAVFGLCCMVFVFHSKNVAGENLVGGLGIEVVKEPRFGSPAFVVKSIAPASPLNQAGIRPGSLLEFDNYHHWQGTRHPGERVGLTVIDQGVPRHVSAVSIPKLLPADKGLTVISILTGFVASVLGVVIAWKRADDAALRALSFYFVLFQFNVMRAVALPGSGMALAQYAWAATIWLIWITIFYFAIKYQDESVGPIRGALRYILPLLMVFAALGSVYYIWCVTHHNPYLHFETTLVINLMAAVILVALWEGWHRATGEARQRHLWILALFGTRTLVGLPTFFANLFGPEWLPMATWLHRIGSLLFSIGFSYSILKHRVLNFGFAVNRALVYTIISTFVLVTFSITEWVIDKLLHFQGRDVNRLVDGFVALVIILSFHRIQHWAHHYVDHTFFRKWYAAASRLRHFLSTVPFISEAKALQTSFVSEIAEFSETRGVALYHANGDGGFPLSHTSLAGAPEEIGHNNPVLVEMRHGHRHVDIARCGGSLPAAHAFPIIVRGALHGFVLIGEHARGHSYRPDEIELIEEATQQIGLNIESLRVEELERASAQLQQVNASLEREARLMRDLIGESLAGARKGNASLAASVR